MSLIFLPTLKQQYSPSYHTNNAQLLQPHVAHLSKLCKLNPSLVQRLLQPHRSRVLHTKRPPIRVTHTNITHTPTPIHSSLLPPSPTNLLPSYYLLLPLSPLTALTTIPHYLATAISSYPVVKLLTCTRRDSLNDVSMRLPGLSMQLSDVGM